MYWRQNAWHSIILNTVKKGFTLIELLVVISVIGILASVLLVALSSAREKAYLTRSKTEFRSIETALEIYKIDHNDQYPTDASRDTMPTGLEKYITGGWPKGPWPGSFYDWDSWDLSGQKIYQISIRFCPIGGDLSSCRFPRQTWATNFDVDSAAYYCIAGSCRSHESQPITYPGYCVNCN